MSMVLMVIDICLTTISSRWTCIVLLGIYVLLEVVQYYFEID